jgi:phosphopantothenoylcysteine decarboxylase
VASVKIPLIVEALLAHANVRVQVIATDNSLHFYDRTALTSDYTVASLAAENLAASRGVQTSGPRVHLWTNADEWTSFTRVGDAILHIELRRWADVVIVAPCSANTLAKLAGGLCDDLLTSFMRALGKGAQVVLCPAMNTLMWENPLTDMHLRTVKEVLGYEVKGPVEKRLACGDTGKGAMIEWSEIVALVADRFGLQKQQVSQDAA